MSIILITIINENNLQQICEFSIYPDERRYWKGEVKNTYPCDPMEVDGEIYLDFDKEGKLIGIEISDANDNLPKELLDKAERIDK